MTPQRRRWLHCLARLPATEDRVDRGTLDALWRLGHVTEGAGSVWTRTATGEMLHDALLRQASPQTRGALADARLARRLGRVVRATGSTRAAGYLTKLDDPATRRRARAWLKARKNEGMTA